MIAGGLGLLVGGDAAIEEADHWHLSVNEWIHSVRACMGTVSTVGGTVTWTPTTDVGVLLPSLALVTGPVTSGGTSITMLHSYR